MEKAELVFKNAEFINVFTETLEHADIAVNNGRIAGIGKYEGETEVDCSGKYLAPGFIDGHIHIESSMMRPSEFARTVLLHGTTAVITDPHEIANVCGIDGVKYMLQASEGLPLEVYLTLPSCVPATAFDENGCIVRAEDLVSLYSEKRVVGLAEVMDYTSTTRGEEGILKKIADAKRYNKIVDGHAPGLSGKELCSYILAGVESDHECVCFNEAREKLSRGQWIMIREGTAARNLDALMGLFQPPYYQRAMLVTDDKHPYDLLNYGHMDELLRKAVKKGADPIIAVKMATLNTAGYFKLKGLGAIAPGYQADIVMLSDLSGMRVEKVFKAGRPVVENNSVVPFHEPAVDREIINKVYHSFQCRSLEPSDLKLSQSDEATSSGHFRVIQFVSGEIGTKEVRIPLINGEAAISTEKDILKIAAVERHHNTGHIGIGFVNGYGLKKGAIASSVSHDSHNIIVVGTNDEDMALAVNCIREMKGGWSIAEDGNIAAKLSLPIAGLISEIDAATLAKQIEKIKSIAGRLGVSEGIDPFMTLAFVSLPVIPELRLTTSGLFDVSRQKLVSVYV